MRPSFVCLILLAGCAARPAPAPVPEPPRGAYLPLQVAHEPDPPGADSRRALEAEWPPVGLAGGPTIVERPRRRVRPRARWVTAPDGAVIEVSAAEAQLRPCPIPVRVVRLPDPPAFLLDPPE